MDREFENAAKCWLNQCGADLKNKVENLLDENDSNPVELAEEINVEEEEIYGILEGDVESISVDTLIRVFMVLGLAVEVRPIEETPLGGYDNVNPHVMRQPQSEERREPRQNPFVQPPVPHGMGRNFPPRDFDPSRIPPHVREEMEREFERRHPMGDIRDIPPFNPRREAPQSPFETMDDERMKRIIRHELWDSEINLNTASHRDLVKFLTEKDKRKQEIARRDKQEKEVEELERDPQVADFVKRMKKNIKDNPQFRSYMKNFLNNLDEE